jgi:hypothetical protein
VETNTLDPTAVSELVLSYTFGKVSSVLLVVTQRTGSVQQWTDPSYLQAALKLTYGFGFL